MNGKRFRFKDSGQNGQDRGHNRQRPMHRLRYRLRPRASSDRTLARMTHMLAPSAHSASKDARGRVTEIPENSWPAYASRNKENSTPSIKARSRLNVSAAMYTCHSFGQEVCPGTPEIWFSWRRWRLYRGLCQFAPPVRDRRLVPSGLHRNESVPLQAHCFGFFVRCIRAH